MTTVTTIIPAYNAGKTLATTLRSALAQTIGAHEIIVVDDGSTDDTNAIAAACAARHPHVRVVRQRNAGLAGARNTGLREAAGTYVAPLDADDLWLPDKLERQVAALEAMPGAALAYGWFRKIDAEDRVIPASASPCVAGWVWHRHLDWNFVSNGSTPLVRTDVAREIRYDPAMTLGCEDYLFQLQIARRYPFACAPAYVTGYRRVLGSMSTHVGRMIRAHLQMYALLEKDADRAARRIIAGQRARLEVEWARNRVRRGGVTEALGAFGRALGADTGAAARTLTGEARTAIARLRRPMFAAAERPFADYAPQEPDGVWTSGRSARRDAWLAALDAAGSAAHPAGHTPLA